MNEVIEKEFYELISEKDIEFLKKFDEYEKRAKVIKDTIKQNAHEFLEKNNLLEQGYRQDGIYIYEKKPYTKNVVDTEKLKEQGLYDMFTKKSTVNGSVVIQIEYEDWLYWRDTHLSKR